MILVYGAYGYTGRLIVDEAKKHGLQMVLAGRSEAKTMAMANEFQLSHRSFDLEEPHVIAKHLEDVELVIHCAGPFEFTAEAMAKACILSKTHYIDITGEYQVFDLLKAMDANAKAENIMLLPGAGFDVVPSDCLANMLKKELPDGTHLELAFSSQGGSLSRGTAKTMIENIHKGQFYRQDGDLKQKKHGAAVKQINYGEFEQLSVGISWGDISSAYYSTGIKNIEVYTGTTAKQVRQMKWANWLKSILAMRWVKNFLKKQIDKKPAGPSDEKRNKGAMLLWGSISDGNNTIDKRLKTPNGYTLTAKTAVLISEKILAGNFKPGYQTPASAYDEKLILEVEGCQLL